MIHYYQLSLWPFLQFKAAIKPSSNIERTYFHSFEDGLWALLPAAKIAKGSTLLLPDFYCEDVIHNIKNHGYQVERYSLDEHFQITTDQLITRIDATNAQVVVLFHAAGITNKITRNLQLVTSLTKKCLVIEDCVQRLVNPSEVTLLNDNHVVMDSLRKVSPLPGSYLYYQKKSLPKLTTQIHYQPTWYQFVSLTVYIIFRAFLTLSYWLNSYRLAKWATEKLLVDTMDEIIGDGMPAQKGIKLLAYPLQWFDFPKIEAKKREQVEYYEKLLKPWLNNSQMFYKVKFPKSDWDKLHVYPLGISQPATDNLRHYLHKQQLLIWDKFPDCPWSKDKSVLFLPLGFHVTQPDQRKISMYLSKYNSFTALT